MQTLFQLTGEDGEPLMDEDSIPNDLVNQLMLGQQVPQETIDDLERELSKSYGRFERLTGSSYQGVTNTPATDVGEFREAASEDEIGETVLVPEIDEVTEVTEEELTKIEEGGLNKFTIGKDIPNLKKEGNVWKVYDEESNSYKNLPKEYVEDISINGKFQKIPVIRGDRTIRGKDGSVSTERGAITHIYVDGKWKKESVPEKKKKKPKKTSRVSGTIKAPSFQPIYEEGEYEEIQKERDETYQWFRNKLLNQIKS